VVENHVDARRVIFRGGPVIGCQVLGVLLAEVVAIFLVVSCDFASLSGREAKVSCKP
jgi:hypothetical protein